jgi:hypothetical protein
MNSKHQILLQQNKHNIWNIILYKFYSGNINIIFKQIRKNIINIINHYFQHIIISKPVLHFENGVLKIKIFYYSKYNYTHIYISKTNKTKQPPWNYTFLVKFENLLKKYFGYPIELQLIKLNNPTLNANILAQLIAINLKNYGLSKIWKILLRKIKIQIPITKNTKQMTKMHLNWMHILNKGIYCKEFNSQIIGFKLKLSGRISKRKGASRTSIINRSIGILQLNSINSYIDYGHIEKKDKNGSQSIKVYIANSIIFTISSLINL